MNRRCLVTLVVALAAVACSEGEDWRRLPEEEPDTWTGPRRPVPMQLDLFDYCGKVGKSDSDRLWDLSRGLYSASVLCADPGERFEFTGFEVEGDFTFAFDVLALDGENRRPSGLELEVRFESAGGAFFSLERSLDTVYAPDQDWFSCSFERALPGPLTSVQLTVRPRDAREVPGADIVVLRPTLHYEAQAPDPDSLPAPPTQIVLVTLDTMRADYLGAYGNGEVVTPVLDAFAGESVLFEEAHSVTNVTKPGHTSIFTGLFLKDHGVEGNLMTLAADTPTMMDALRERGFRTAAFIGCKNMGTRRSKLHTRFDDFYDCKTLQRRAVDVNRDVLPWMAKHAHEDFFAWIHYYDMHTAYIPPHPYGVEHWDEEELGPLLSYPLDPAYDKEQYLRPELVEHCKALYRGEAAALDADLGAVFDHLRRLGIYDRAWILVTSDHGENFGEEGHFSTHSGLTDASTQVPMILKAPGQALRGRVPGFTQTIDLYPTLFDYLGFEIDDPVRGTSLRSLIETGSPSERTRIFAEHSDMASVSVRTDRFRYVANLSAEDRKPTGRKRLYDYELDLLESMDVKGDHRELAQELQRQLEAFLAEGIGLESVEMDDEEFREELEDLGYL